MSRRPFDPVFLDALEETVVKWEGRVWRQVFEGSDPFRENTRGARWNPPEVAALYCSLSAEGAAREIDHIIALQSIEIKRRRITHELDVHLGRVADLRHLAPLYPFEIDVESVTSPSWDVPQEIGSAASWLECGGLLVPSARHGSANLVIFINNLAHDDLVEPVGQAFYPSQAEGGR